MALNEPLVTHLAKHPPGPYEQQVLDVLPRKYFSHNGIRVRMMLAITAAGDRGITSAELERWLDLRADKLDRHLETIRFDGLVHTTKSGRHSLVMPLAHALTLTDLPKAATG